MVLKADSHAKSLSLLQSALVSNFPSPKQQNFFTNHQKWQINRHLDCKSGSPTFYLRDSYGISYTVTEFIVENLDLEFREALGQLTSSEEQQKLIHGYLQKRLDQATSYQVHVERYGDKLFLRFGDYGLKGGMRGNEEDQNFLGKTGALLFSAVQIGFGLYLTFREGNPGRLGGVLVSSGFSSGLYAYQTGEKEKKYKDKEYAKQATYGALTGLITGAFGKVAEGASKMAKIGDMIKFCG